MIPRPIAALAKWVSGRPLQALAAVLVMTSIMGFFARDVRLDNNFAKLFSNKSAAAQFRETYRNTFGPDDGLLVVVLHTDRPDEQFFDTIRAVSDRVASMHELSAVRSVTTVPVVRTAPSLALDPAFSANTASLPLGERIRMVASSDLGAANLLSRSGDTALVVGELKTDYNSYERVTGPADDFERRARSAVRDAPGSASIAVHTAGIAFTRIAAISEMQGDLLKLFPLATLVMIVLLWFFFRRPVAVVGPVMAIGSSIVCTAGVIGAANDNINQITIIFPVLLMGVVVATATHLVHRFYVERAAGSDATTAARTTLERIARAAIVCTITNAIGFASLATAKMEILHQFGLYLAAGVGFCFIATSLVVPALLVLRNSEPPPRYLAAETAPTIPGVIEAPTTTRRYAEFIVTGRHAPVILASGLLLVIVAALVASTAHYDYSLSGMLNADRPVSIGNSIIDRDLSGMAPIEISALGPPGSFGHAAALRDLETFDRWLAEHESLRPVGLPSLIRAAPALALRDPTGSDGAALSFTQTLTAFDKSNHTTIVESMVTPDLAHTRLRAFHPDTGARSIVELASRIERRGNEIFAGTGVVIRVTGEAPVAYAGMNDLTRELIEATLVALVLIVLAIGVAFRSIGLALVALLPNIAPIAVGMAFYTWANDILDPVPAIAFCIAMGLAADDTVHLMNRIRELRPNFATSGETLVAALVSVRRAMVSSSVVLVGAFLALGVSGFPTNRTLSALGATVLVLALGSDLLFGAAALAVLGRVQDRRGRNIDGSRLDVSRRERGERPAPGPGSDAPRTPSPTRAGAG